MGNYNQELKEENAYLDRVISFINSELEGHEFKLAERKRNLIIAGKEMYENAAHDSTEFEKRIDIYQHLNMITTQNAAYTSSLKEVKKYQRMIDSPYFGRFDFTEKGYGQKEKIYIGMGTLTDSKTHDVYVYDWRAPISSIFYRYEPGAAQYLSPHGEINGQVIAKRQYKIKDSELLYFFDCSVRISDDILQEVLGRNSSPKMRNIVETIQKEQDIIIRDTESQMLIVQGVAGSGKTSIALHRIAFLLYEGIGLKLAANNILIISPNDIFSNYISTLLPELGEENVQQKSTEDIFNLFFKDSLGLESRNEFLEKFISAGEGLERKIMGQSLEFRGSRKFITILDRLLELFEHKLLSFEDVYYNGIIIEKKELLKTFFLKDKYMPMAKRLKRLEKRILEKIHPLQKIRLEKIKKIVTKSEGRDFQIKSFSRYLAIKEAKVLMNRLHKFTQVDTLEIYKILFKDKRIFNSLTKDIALPENIQDIIKSTLNSLENGTVLYEDTMPLLYMKLKIEGNEGFNNIKQVVVDEAQDYYPMHYEVMKQIFRDASYTVLGDYGQGIEKDRNITLYDEIIEIFDKEKTVKLALNKSYRASYEINQFNQRFLKGRQEIIAFERHETEPKVIQALTQEQMEDRIISDIQAYLKEGFESIAVICKTLKQATELCSKLSKGVNCKLINHNNSEIEKGIMIIPGYLAKGLEFDVVMIYDASQTNYVSDLDRRLLYIAASRALHRLNLYAWGQPSTFLK